MRRAATRSAAPTARGYVGPDLTHLASRTHARRRDDPGHAASYLARWIVDPQHVKPGNEMPDFHLTGAQLSALVAYLESLK